LGCSGIILWNIYYCELILVRIQKRKELCKGTTELSAEKKKLGDLDEGNTHYFAPFGFVLRRQKKYNGPEAPGVHYPVL